MSCSGFLLCVSSWPSLSLFALLIEWICSWLLENDFGLNAHDAYGKVLGTAAVCSLFLIGLSLIPRKYIKSAFPPVVTSVIIILVGLTVLTTSLA